MLALRVLAANYLLAQEFLVVEVLEPYLLGLALQMGAEVVPFM
jgi:hypothetical protein